MTPSRLTPEALDAVLDALDPDDRSLAYFLLGSSRRVRSHVLYQRRGNDLACRWRELSVAARRFPTTRARSPLIVWTSSEDKHIEWRLEAVAKATRIPAQFLRTFRPPRDVATAASWLAIVEGVNRLRRHVFNRGLRPVQQVLGRGAATQELLAGAKDTPGVIEVHPTMLRRGSPLRPTPRARPEAWVTPAGLQVVRAARHLADAQGMPWADALRMMSGAGQ